MPHRLSLLDATLLAQERSNTPMHLGGFGIFAPGLSLSDVSASLARRLDGVPLARSRMQETAIGAGRPVWVDDVDFDLSFHVRHAALPQPGDLEQLWDFIARLIARPLDRARPLWELYFIEGLEGGRTALFRKVHLAMVGPGGVDPFGVLLDDGPLTKDGNGAQSRWEPRTPPSQARLTMDATRERLNRVRQLGQGLQASASVALRDPLTAARTFAGAAGSAASVAKRMLVQAPASALNTRLTPHRRFVSADLPLDDFRTVRRAVGSTLNDVVIAVTADAVGRLLRWRGHDTKDLDLRVMVPVRVHGAGEGVRVPDVDVVQTGEEGAVGVVAPLPVMQMDPVARLYRVMGEMAAVLESRQAVGADSLIRIAGYGPAALHATAARVASAEARYNVALSNAPGPQAPLYLAGVRMEETYPFIPLAGDCALSVAVNSYSGRVFVGLLGDRDAMSDLDLLVEFYAESLSDMVAAAKRLNR